MNIKKLERQLAYERKMHAQFTKEKELKLEIKRLRSERTSDVFTKVGKGFKGVMAGLAGIHGTQMNYYGNLYGGMYQERRKRKG